MVLAELSRRSQVQAKNSTKQENAKKKQQNKKSESSKTTKKADTSKGPKDKDQEDKEKDADAGKWQITHQQLAETRYFVIALAFTRFCFHKLLDYDRDYLYK